MEAWDCVIIGAGMAGLTAAQLLKKNSQTVLVLDKGRGVGGRVATRRMGESRADHGAACFRLENEKLAPLWKDALESLSCQAAPPSLEARAWTCSLGMNALAKALAAQLSIELQQTVRTLEYDGRLWTCRTEAGSWSSRQVLVTSPLWQSAEFFKNTNPEHFKHIQDLAQDVSYAPQWTVIIKLAPGISVPGEPHQKDPHHDIASAYDQGRKGLPHAEGVWVVQASRAFSIAQVDADATFILERMTETLCSLGWNLQGAEMQAHRWRYAFVQKPLTQNFVKIETADGLCLAGDFCLGSTIEGAAASGYAAAEHLLKRMV